MNSLYKGLNITMKKLLIIISFIFISFYSSITYAEYIANGQFKGWVCNWGACSMQNLDAVKSGSSYYTIKKNHKSVDDYKNGKCTVNNKGWFKQTFYQLRLSKIQSYLMLTYLIALFHLH